MYEDKYRPCPVCKSKLSEFMRRQEGDVRWDVYECKNCGSEVWIDPFKRIRASYGK
jgi:uncharacterized protein with PIN domain